MSHHAVFLTLAIWSLICTVIAGAASLFGFASIATISWLTARILFSLFALYAVPMLLIGLSDNERQSMYGHRKARTY